MTDSSSQPLAGKAAIEDPGRMARRLMQLAHNQDGLPEIVTGAFLLVVSALMTAQLYPAKSSVLEKAFALAMVAVIVPAGLVLPWFIRWLRRRYLIAREGYFESSPTRAKTIKIAIGIAIGAVALLCFAIAAKRGMVPPDRWLLAGTGLAAGLGSAWFGRSRRFVIVGLLAAVAGIAIGFSGVSLAVGLAVLFGITGTMTLMSGLVVLRRFLRQTVESGE